MSERETPLPPCGIYRTTMPTLDGIKADRLVYFHNHGDPAAGVYYPTSWTQNRAQFDKKGFLIPSDEYAQSLTPLAKEGFYVVRSDFHCCEKLCRAFTPGTLVQLGYNAEGEPLLFLPGWRANRFDLPERGFAVDSENLGKLEALQVMSYRLQANDG